MPDGSSSDAIAMILQWEPTRTVELLAQAIIVTSTE
jgi:hypothetical protein